MSKKLVNINSRSILYVFSPPLEGVIQRTELSLGDIRYCLNRGAQVEEILEDESTVTLTLENYDKKFTPKQRVDKVVNQEVQKPIQEKVKEVLDRSLDSIDVPEEVVDTKEEHVKKGKKEQELKKKY